MKFRPLFGSETQLEDITQEKIIKTVKSNIWRPTDVEDYMNLKPRLIYTNDSSTYNKVGIDGSSVEVTTDRTKELPEKWNTLRTFMSTMKNNSNIGRNLNFMVEDEVTGKYLGVVCISSDFLDLTPRDEWIEWERGKEDTRSYDQLYCYWFDYCGPTQPLGFNYVGGENCLLFFACRILSRGYGKKSTEIHLSVLPPLHYMAKLRPAACLSTIT